LLKTLPDTPERAQQEITLQITLGLPLMATKGYAAPEVEQAYTQARDLCQAVGKTRQLLPVLAGLATFFLVRAELQITSELAEQFFCLSQKGQNPADLQVAHYLIGEVLLHRGELPQARTRLEQGIDLYDPQKRPPGAWNDPGVACLCIAAYALWSLGYPDQALKRCHEALSLAQELAHPFSLAFALYGTARLHQFRRELEAAHQYAKTLIALSTEQGFALREAAGIILEGWALSGHGRREGVTQICQGVAAHRATGAELYRPYFLALLAEACGTHGQVEEGMRVMAEALAAVDKTGERFYEAELYRLKGQLTLQSTVQGLKAKTEEEAEACFHKAVEIARRQQAKSLELRAVMSLSRLWQQQGKQQEAHEVLAEIYGWFTEGFDTKDLQEAKALLEELEVGH
jgi:predicted ATPase